MPPCLTRRDFVVEAGLIAAGLMMSQRASAAVRRSQRPNIILAMTDDQGWGDVGYNGNEVIQTPVLDEMAAKGIRFDRFYAAAPVCSPTRGSCMTGRHPNRYGCFSWGYDLPLDEMTLAEALKGAGYATGHFGKWHLGGIPTSPGKQTRTNRGSLQSPQPPHPGNQGFDEWFSYWNFFDLNPRDFYHNGQPVGPLAGDGSDIIVEHALRWISGIVAEKRPFFAVVWFGNPHGPHQALDGDKALYRNQAEKQQSYLGEISGVDRAMGTLRKGLRELGVARNTMLWFCSDNGGTAVGNNGGLRGHKGSLWEGGVRVPGILEWPDRVPKPFRTSMPACTSDFYPTIVELLGVDVPDQPQPLDGVSLLPLLDGRMDERSTPIAFEIRSNADTVRWAALSGDRYKLHVGPDRGSQGTGGGRPAGTMLFDLINDPTEQRDIAAEEPDVAAAMKKELEDWQASVERSLAGDDYRK